VGGELSGGVVAELVEGEVELVPEVDASGGGADGTLAGNPSVMGATEEFAAVPGGKFVDDVSTTVKGAEAAAASCARLREEPGIQSASIPRKRVPEAPILVTGFGMGSLRYWEKRENFEKIEFIERACSPHII
jgi:hypothetical protein